MSFAMTINENGDRNRKGSTVKTKSGFHDDEFLFKVLKEGARLLNYHLREHKSNGPSGGGEGRIESSEGGEMGVERRKGAKPISPPRGCNFITAVYLLGVYNQLWLWLLGNNYNHN